MRRGFSPIAILLAAMVLIVGGVVLFISKTFPNGEEVERRVSEMMEKDETMMGGKGGEMMGEGGGNMMPDQGGMMGNDLGMGMSKPEIVVFPVIARNYSFGPAEIRVKKGTSVRIELRVEEGFHDWVLNEFNARTAQAGAGKTVTVEFVADKPGTFEYYCSVGEHRKLGMVGKLTVE